MSVRSFQQIVDDAERQRRLLDSACYRGIIRQREERRQADANKMRAACAALEAQGARWNGERWTFG